MLLIFLQAATPFCWDIYPAGTSRGTQRQDIYTRTGFTPAGTSRGTQSQDTFTVISHLTGTKERHRGTVEKGWLLYKSASSDCSYELHTRNIRRANCDWHWTIFISVLYCTEHRHFFLHQYSTAKAFLLRLREILPPLILFSSDNLRTEMAIILHLHC